MPRPSDLYATLGVPGMYPSTPWTSYVLPNVFVCPPEEDNEDAFCLFHSGSTSSSTLETFYRNRNRNKSRHSVYTHQHPTSPTLTDMPALDNALPYIKQQTSTRADAPSLGRKPGREHGERVLMPTSNVGSPSSSSSSPVSFSGATQRPSNPTGEAAVLPNVSFTVEREGPVEGRGAPSRSSSRRSSVFGERPVDCETTGVSALEDSKGRLGKSQGRALKSRAAVVFKSMGNARVRKTESDVVLSKPAVVEVEASDSENVYFSDQGTTSDSKLTQRRSSTQPLSSNSNVDIYATPPGTPSPPPTYTSPLALPTRETKLSKRRSMTQLFGITSSSTELSPPLSPPTLKLSKRKSMSQLFGLGRSTPSTPMHRSDAEDLGADPTDPRLTALQALEGPSSPPDVARVHVDRSTLRRSITSSSVPDLAQSPGVRATMSPPPPSEKSSRRKSFLSTRAFSFLDIHRHFSSHSAPNTPAQTSVSTSSTPASLPDSPNPPSEATDSSSSHPPSLDSELEAEDTIRIFKPRMAPPSYAVVGRQGNAAVDINEPPELFSSDRPNQDKEAYGFSRLSLHEPKNFDVEIESGADEQFTLELATRLDSLTFDRLAFDPASFAGLVQT